jgi:hypothetical protein
MTLESSFLAKPRIINYDSRIVIYSFIVLAITIVNYDHKTFIAQVTGANVIKLFAAVIYHYSKLILSFCVKKLSAW